MKATWAFFLVTLFSLLVSAEVSPVLAEGIFKFRGDYSVESFRRIEIVVAMNDEARARIDQLLSEGYGCVAQPREHYVCAKWFELENINPEVKKRVLEKFQRYEVRFYKPAHANLVTNGEVYKQWSVEQKVIIKNGEGTRIMETCDYTWSPGTNRIYPGGVQNPKHDIFNPDPQGLSIPVSLNITLDRFHMEQYQISVKLRRN